MEMTYINNKKDVDIKPLDKDDKPLDYSDTTIIIPTLNEAGNIKELVGELKSTYNNIEIIVVDDGSTDGTLDIIKNQCILIDRSNYEYHGLTISVLVGIEAAKTEYCIVMDADGQHPVPTVGNMIQALRNGADVVVGVRNNSIELRSTLRKIISSGALLLGQISFRSRGSARCGDVVSGFFGIKRDLAISKISSNGDSFVMEGYKVLFDFLKVLPNTTCIEEIDYVFGVRRHGKSKLRFRHIRYFIQSVLR